MIDASYRTYLLNQIIGDYLRDGKIPNANQVEADLQSILADFPDQTNPLLYYKYKNLKVKPAEVSSANKYNQFFDTLKQDMLVLQQECQNNDAEQGYELQRNLQEISMLSSRIKALDHQLNSQLLVNRDTVGYGSYLADNFADASLIDLTQSTARVDLNSHCAVIGPGANTFTLYPTSQLQESNFNLSILSRNGLVRSNPNFKDLANAFSSDNNNWRMQLYYDNCNNNIIVEISLKLSDTPISLNRISFINYGVSNYRTLLETFTSVDNYNWTLVQTGSPSYYITDTVDLRFPDTQTKWVKFRFTKEHYDLMAGKYFVYEFGIQAVRFFRYSYEDTSAVLISKPLEASTTFNQVSLEVCESLPYGTDIQYALSFDEGNTFSSISPLGRPGMTQSLLQLGQTEKISTPDFNLDLATNYHYTDPNLILLSAHLPDNMIQGSFSLWRNIGTPGYTYPVRNGLSGWGIDGQFYTCTIQVTNTAGFSINLGTTIMNINGVDTSGSIVLLPGIYNIRSNKSYWSHLQHTGQNILYFTRVEDLGNGMFQGLEDNVSNAKINDPLYPYNHKFLIEGMDYRYSDVTQDLVYRGAGLFAETLMTPVSEKDLLYNATYDTINYFTQVPVVLPTGIQQRCLVRYSPLTSNAGDRFDLEVFKAFYQIPTEGAATSVVFKASLSRGDKEVTPQLFSYIIKLAN